MMVLDVTCSACLVAMLLYVVQHFVIAFARLGIRLQQHPVDLQEAADSFQPAVCVVVPAHNECAVIAATLDSLVALDYPPERLRIIVIDDHSTDATAEMVRIRPQAGHLIELFGRNQGTRGKPAALNDVLPNIHEEIVVQFDADYRPTPDFIQRIVQPFRSTNIGLVMGRVVAANVTASLVTRLLDLERTAGYQVVQEGRMRLGLLPMYGGTAGAIRRSTLADLGGWRADALSEDTDLTFRAMLRGWQTVYLNDVICYEQVPVTWVDRERQVIRWARGHNDCLRRYFRATWETKRLHPLAVVDACLLLTAYLSPLVFAAAVALTTIQVAWSNEAASTGMLMFCLGVIAFGTLGNFAMFFEVAAGVRLDCGGRRLRLMPFMILSFLVSASACLQAVIRSITESATRRRRSWDKTPRAEDYPSIADRLPRTSWLTRAERIGLGSVSSVVVVLFVGWSGVALLAAALAVFALPFVPAMSEWLRPMDNSLSVTCRDSARRDGS